MHWAHEFECDFTSSVPWDAVPRVPEQAMTVLTDLCYMGGTRVVSDDIGAALEKFLEQIPPTGIWEH